MAQKRIQVFVSSTYLDLKVERQAVVEAILTAKHVPAGMELFAAGSDSQLNTIRKWIDESDAFLVIVGTRYGSIEPTTKTSYVELEYEYAQKNGKPLFALVLNEEWRRQKMQDLGEKAIDDTARVATFRSRVLEKMSGQCANLSDLKYETLKALTDIARSDAVYGWVSSKEAQTLEVELDRVRAEVAELRAQQTKAGNSTAMDALVTTLGSQVIELQGNKVILLDALIANGPQLSLGVQPPAGSPWTDVLGVLAPWLTLFGLLNVIEPTGALRLLGLQYRLTETGRAVVAHVLAKRAGVTLNVQQTS